MAARMYIHLYSVSNTRNDSCFTSSAFSSLVLSIYAAAQFLSTAIVLGHEPAQCHTQTAEDKADQEDSAESIHISNLARLPCQINDLRRQTRGIFLIERDDATQPSDEILHGGR